jgi:hypothetical protein
MINKHKSLIMVSILMLLAGCVPIPLFTSEPYSEEQFSNIKEGQTDRALVRKTFGEPQAVRLGGTYWFYGRSRPVMVVGLLDIKSGGDAFTTNDYDWVAVSFDTNDKVLKLEHIDDKKGCTANGICLLEGLFGGEAGTYSQERLLQTWAIFSAPPHVDHKAKSFEVHNNSCSVYVYLEGPLLTDQKVDITLNDKSLATINRKTYAFIEVPIGTHKFSVTNVTKDTTLFTLECSSPALFFVCARYNTWSWKITSFGAVDEEEGKHKVMTRRLVLPK